MTMRLRLCAALLLLAAFAGAAAAKTIELSGPSIARVFTYDPGWHTTALLCPIDGWKLATTSDELTVQLQKGTTISGADWVLRAEPKLRSVGDEKRLEVTLGTDKAAGLQAQIVYSVSGRQAWMRKQVRLTGPAGMVVTQVDLEPMTLSPAPPDLSGQGMPMLAGRAWFGAEYPATRNSLKSGRLSILHFPGRDLGAGPLECKTAVWGVAPPHLTVPLAFEDYINTVITQPRDFLHYNSWYDLRGNELTEPRILQTFDGYQKNLLGPYHIKLAAFALDDGWQDYQSIWRPRKNILPDGFAPLAKALEARGTRLGLWMPLSGFHLDTKWGAAQGYEVSNMGDWYCLATAHYYPAMRAATARLIHEGNIAYYKHDFNFLACSATGHEHLPTPEAGHEANVDRTLDLLAYEHRLQPGIFLNVTSGMWYSPWWLIQADAIWGNFPGDTGYNKAWPELTPREWAMSFRDAWLYKMYRERPNNFVPISRLMTHGITQGRYNMLGGENEPLSEWSDYVVLYFGRGVQMKELYISPDRMRPDMWKPVGTAIRWAQRRAPTLARVVMIGGDPEKGEPYGFIHWRADQGIWVLRNPGLDQALIEVPVSQATGYLGQAKLLHAAVVYPYVTPLAEAVTPGRSYRVALPPRSVVVVEVRPASWGLPASFSAPDVQAHETLSLGQGAVEAKIRATAGANEARKARLYVVVKGGIQGTCDITCSAAVPGGRKDVDGQGWQMHVLDLKDLPESFVATIRLPKPGDQAFSVRPGTVSAWLVYEVPARKVTLEDAPKDLPCAIDDGWRRESVRLLTGKVTPTQTLEHLTDTELASAVAAKLRVDVFGVNAGQYADKWILLNGQRLVRVPFNDQNNLDHWQDKILDLTPAQVKSLRRDDVVQFTNEPGDCYKVRGVALAVKLPDGRWVQSTEDDQVYSSVAGWLWTEGKVFQGGKSPEIHLQFR